MKLDHIQQINLDNRKDRKQQFLDWIQKTGFPEENVSRITAVYTPESGALGCFMSHIQALKTFLDSPYLTVVIHEDDQEPVDPENYWNTLHSYLDTIPDFDVVLLAQNHQEGTKTDLPWLFKLSKAQTTSGQIVTRKFAQTLLQNFEQGLEEQKQQKNRTGHYIHTLAIDVHWQKLMTSHNFYCIIPRLGKQRESQSDIEKKYVNQGV